MKRLLTILTLLPAPALVAADAGTPLRWSTYNFANQPAYFSLVDTNCVMVTEDSNFGLILHSDGTLYPYGSNNYGQTNIPAGAATGVIYARTCWRDGTSITSDGQVHTWGALSDAFTGAAMDTPTTTNAIKISGGDHHFACLKSDNTILVWAWDAADPPNNGYRMTNDMPAAVTNGGVVDLDSGWYQALALKEDGQVYCWWWKQPPIGDHTVPANATNVSKIVALPQANLALRSNGTVVAWGDDEFGQLTSIAAASGVMDIGGGRDHTMALFTNGTVQCWGRDNFGQSSPPSSATNIGKIFPSYWSSLALKNLGEAAPPPPAETAPTKSAVVNGKHKGSGRMKFK